MLDGLLGRGFASKCKSLIKATKARIELIRKKRIAREKFLKKDIADLLANGLDANAYGRTEGLVTELTITSCYDFVEQCCDLVYKLLSLMQRQSECPAECKAAVASLIFAAARVSDLPELRELRETFQEKYGNSLQYCVNQKFVEDLSSPPPKMEKKIHLMRDIATEYSISWNSRPFEKQMSKTEVLVQEQPSNQISVPVKDNLRTRGGNSVDEKDKHYIPSKVRYELSPDQYGTKAKNGDGRGEEINLKLLGRKDIYSNRQMPHKFGYDNARRRADDDSLSLKGKEAQIYEHQAQNEMHSITVPASLSERSSYGREQDGIQRERALQDNREVTLPKREVNQTFSLGKLVIHSHTEKLKVPDDDKDILATVLNADNLQDADKPKAKSSIKMIPPPYMKPPKAPKAENDSDLMFFGFNGSAAGISSGDVASRLKLGYSNKIDETRYVSSHVKNAKETSECSKGVEDGSDDKHINQNDSTGDVPVPKPKSVRRRYSSRPSSSHDGVIGNLEDAKKEKRSDAKRGLEILFDDDPRLKDDEKVLDKLLIHFSMKPTNFDLEKLRRRSDVEAPRGMLPEVRETRHNGEGKIKPGNVSPLAPSHNRTVSLPHEQSIPPEPVKVFARAASFQPDRPAKHVHPNLPDCNDLAARIAALRGSC